MPRKLATRRASYASSSEQQRPLAWPGTLAPSGSPCNCAKRRWFQSCIVSPIRRGGPSVCEFELFSARSAATVELSTPPLIATAVVIRKKYSVIGFQSSVEQFKPFLTLNLQFLLTTDN